MEISSSHSHTFFSQTAHQKIGIRQGLLHSTNQDSQKQAEVSKLKKRDREVRTHEQAHIAAAGGLVKGGATFSFQRGPDGKQYAVGGEVNIDTSPVSSNPEATIRKAKKIRAAALAPADPSPHDRAVAASAIALESQAKQELQNQKQKTTLSKAETPVSVSSFHIDLFV